MVPLLIAAAICSLCAMLSAALVVVLFFRILAELQALSRALNATLDVAQQTIGRMASVATGGFAHVAPSSQEKRRA